MDQPTHERALDERLAALEAQAAALKVQAAQVDEKLAEVLELVGMVPLEDELGNVWGALARHETALVGIGACAGTARPDLGEPGALGGEGADLTRTFRQVGGTFTARRSPTADTSLDAVGRISENLPMPLVEQSQQVANDAGALAVSFFDLLERLETLQSVVEVVCGSAAYDNGGDLCVRLWEELNLSVAEDVLRGIAVAVVQHTGGDPVPEYLARAQAHAAHHREVRP